MKDTTRALIALIGSFVFFAELNSGIAQAAPITFRITVGNTGVLNGMPGTLEFQFNPSGPAAQQATASIFNFSMIGGSLVGSTFVFSGNVTGDLAAGTLVIANDLGLNAADQDLIYGSSFQFDLTLAGPALDNPMGGVDNSVFGLFLFDSVFNTPLQTDVDGTTAKIRILPNGMPQVVNAAPLASVLIIPEPGMFGLFAVGLAGLAAYRRWRERRSRRAPGVCFGKREG